MRMLIHILKWLVLLALLLGAAAWAFLQFHPVFGGRPDAQSLARMQASKAWRDGAFYNLETTPVLTSDEAPSVFTWALKMLRPPPGKVPAAPLPGVPFDASKLHDGALAWLGHSTVVMRLAGKTIATDPVFYNASPVPFTVSPFPMQQRPRTADMPPLDAVLISHDHYDHLDWRAIRELAPRVGHFYVPLGVRAHLLRWGVADEKVTELDWEEKAQLGDIDITLDPRAISAGAARAPRPIHFPAGNAPKPARRWTTPAQRSGAATCCTRAENASISAPTAVMAVITKRSFQNMAPLILRCWSAAPTTGNGR